MALLHYVAQIRPRSIVVYPHYERTKGLKYYREKSYNIAALNPPKEQHDITKEDNKAKGVLSDHAIRRLRYAVNLLEYSSPWQSVINPSTQAQYPFKLGFLTLTLPTSQGSITDATLKREALMPYLLALQARFGKFSYVWKAETQANGNLHFHVTLNKWIDYCLLRHYWNLRLRALGFIAEYKRQQELHHANGFNPRQELFDHWPEDKQRKAYEFGTVSGWNEPNSIDIHSVRNVNNLSAYLIKYMSKKEVNRRKISGKVWGCSKNLTYNNKFELVEDGLILKDGGSIKEHFKSVKLETDVVHCFIRDEIIWETQMSRAIQDQYSKWLNAIYSYKDSG